MRRRITCDAGFTGTETLRDRNAMRSRRRSGAQEGVASAGGRLRSKACCATSTSASRRAAATTTMVRWCPCLPQCTHDVLMPMSFKHLLASITYPVMSQLEPESTC